MASERPAYIDSEWCPDCDSELRFTGTQKAGFANFFCDHCRYRHDRYVGRAAARRYRASESASDPSTSSAPEPGATAER